jgi:hypothetical protein
MGGVSKPRPSDVRAVRKADRRRDVFGPTGRSAGVLAARREVLVAANRGRISTRPLNMRQIQIAAHICRKFRRVSAATLEAAGFRP